MRTFLIKAGLFGIIVIGTLGIGEIYVRHLPNPYKYKNEWMNKHADSVEVLIFGSSHTFHGINPECMSKDMVIFNMAATSQPLAYDYALFCKWQEHYRNLKVIIIPVSYFSLFSNTMFSHSQQNWYYDIYYRIYYNLEIQPYISKYNLELSHFSVYWGKICAGLRDEPLHCNQYGFGLEDKLEYRRYNWKDSEFGLAAKERHSYSDWSRLKENAGYLEKMIVQSISKGVIPILITTPTYHTYYDLLDKTQLDKMQEVVQELCKKYSIEYYDYLRSDLFSDDDFFNSDHLNEYGACKFSQMLNEVVLKSIANKRSIVE